MRSPAFLLLALLLLPWSAHAVDQPPVRQLTRADALPLALDPAFDFRKTKLFFLESLQNTRFRNAYQDRFNERERSDARSIGFERKRLLFGAVTPSDERDRYGNYFTFFWRTRRPADLVLRLEYRQGNLGPLVQAREVAYPAARPGSRRTEFRVIGDDYAQDGRVSSWRAVLIERAGPPGSGGRIVALTQSYLWR